MIYLSPSAPVSAGTTITLTLKDVPNPDYVINGNNNYKILGFTQINRKVDRRYEFSFSKVFQPGTIFTFFKANAIDSVSAG